VFDCRRVSFSCLRIGQASFIIWPLRSACRPHLNLERKPLFHSLQIDGWFVACKIELFSPRLWRWLRYGRKYPASFPAANSCTSVENRNIDHLVKNMKGNHFVIVPYRFLRMGWNLFAWHKEQFCQGCISLTRIPIAWDRWVLSKALNRHRYQRVKGSSTRFFRLLFLPILQACCHSPLNIVVKLYSGLSLGSKLNFFLNSWNTRGVLIDGLSNVQMEPGQVCY